MLESLGCDASNKFIDRKSSIVQLFFKRLRLFSTLNLRKYKQIFDVNTYGVGLIFVIL